MNGGGRGGHRHNLYILCSVNRIYRARLFESVRFLRGSLANTSLGSKSFFFFLSQQMSGHFVHLYTYIHIRYALNYITYASDIIIISLSRSSPPRPRSIHSQPSRIHTRALHHDRGLEWQLSTDTVFLSSPRCRREEGNFLLLILFFFFSFLPSSFPRDQ